ncbi:MULTISPECIES: ABC transporter ATP-binding protein [unclassified Rhizobium]|jgi:peptide/nickel transport system ATP-binding protein|uniref:ABC transporter ATP-binding protein n=1 Tax=unclassified Rhizobium TaxID=2613769 RepID=UPI0006464257|nr:MULTISPECIES: ABC transporter ATP-binding protein [unclassified Rhizobium]MBN8953940.1 ABC transporter ATP-binding protein [Rhizobium tropici]OJY72211.1 MAG: glutathione ABC transporter ATP-binding protein GsiA [Rhizobium sp. 60-20]RKD50940.1 peptide/nickel transport system ATP-binding protein [Rhizobium sp. WW_1]
MTRPILSISKLNTAFRVGGEWRNVVSDISFDIGPKETVAVVGESGSGKSVTAMSIMRLLSPINSRITGRIEFEGRDLLSLPLADMQAIRGNRIGMIFQEPMTSLNPVLKIGQQITEVLVQHRGMSQSQAVAEAVRLLDKVRIPSAKSRLNEYPMNFSGGMRQRVVIAIALACDPKLLIADEPTTALDVTIQAQILGLIKTLQEEEGMSVLFITHDMGVVAEISDRTVVMYRGEQVETDTTAALFAGARHPYTRALLSAVPQLGSMTGKDRPLRFPQVDMATGEVQPVKPTEDTVRLNQPPILKVDNLVTRFPVKRGFLRRTVGSIHAVEGVSLELRQGETLSLVGESGCGKSTTGRSIIRLAPATSGEIRIDGKDVLKAGKGDLADIRREAQMIFQDPFESLNPRMRIGQALAEPIIAHGLASASQAKDRVRDLLERVGLSAEMADRFPHEFSGGQRQRVCIARALALEPKLLIADESVSALDVSVKAQVINLMLDLQEKYGLGYLFISHDMAVVERISHRVAVMYLGEIVEIGPRHAVFDNPQHDYTKRLMAAVPIADPARRQVRRISNEEIGSPFRRADYQPPKRRYEQASDGHFFQVA